MIRNVVLGRLVEGADERLLEEGLAAIAGLDCPGMLAVHAGRDLRLRDGGWDFAITADFIDARAYQNYDLDPEHNRIRQQLIAPVCETIARVQFDLPSPAPG